jgi:hypothetical protein
LFVGDRLGKTLCELGAIPYSELFLWYEWFTLKDKAIEKATKRGKGKR